MNGTGTVTRGGMKIRMYSTSTHETCLCYSDIARVELVEMGGALVISDIICTATAEVVVE